MNRTKRQYLISGLILAVGLGQSGTAASADQAEPSLTITVHVFNYAQVDQETLSQAKEVATQIFRKVGVDTIWIEQDPNSPQGPSMNASNFQVNILTEQMAKILGLPDTTLGLAPGTPQERGRRQVYVFYHRVEYLAEQQLMALVMDREARARATKGQILGHAMAHEIGHVLLNLESHSSKGVMRGPWNLNDLQLASHGQLLFTSGQAEVIRAEVVRRVRLHGTLEMARLEVSDLNR